MHLFDTQIRNREKMVREQLAARGIKDERVLNAFRKTPRHLFVAPAMRVKSYGDHPLPILEGQTISQPHIIAEMLELAEIRATDRVLEVGLGSGYVAALLAELAEHVVAVERIPYLYRQAREKLESLQYRNILCICGDGTIGYKNLSPYDVIIVSAAAPDIPKTLAAQLAENGRMIIPTGDEEYQELAVIRRNEERFSVTKAGACTFVKLIGIEGWRE